MKPTINGTTCHKTNGYASSSRMKDKEYRKQINTIKEHSGGNFALLHWHHLRYLKGDASATVILCYLLNLLRMKDACSADRDKLQEDSMWFKAPMTNMMRDTAMGYEKVRRCLTTLEDRELIETSNRQGNYLWVRVNTETLEAASENDSAMQKKRDRVARLRKKPTPAGVGENPSQSWGKPKSELGKTQVPKLTLTLNSDKDLDTKFEERKNTAKNPKKKKPAEPVVSLAERQTSVPTDTVAGAAKNAAGSKRTTNPACLEWAGRLKSVTELVKRCRLKDVNVFAWGSEFEKVLNKYGDDEYRVEKALRCYEKAARGGKVDGVAWPIINGPKHFGNVFTWLESNAAKVEVTAEKKRKSDHFAANGVL